MSDDVHAAAAAAGGGGRGRGGGGVSRGLFFHPSLARVRTRKITQSFLFFSIFNLDFVELQNVTQSFLFFSLFLSRAYAQKWQMTYALLVVVAAAVMARAYDSCHVTSVTKGVT